MLNPFERNQAKNKQNYAFLLRLSLIAFLKGADTEYSKQYNAKRIEHFHEFCSMHYDFPYIENFSQSQFSSDNPFVRASFITESVYNNLRNSISQISDLDTFTKAGIEALLIIAFRTGLRRGELVKLTLDDIENSDDKWLFIKNNKYGNNKTYNGLRKIPLNLLLTKVEAKFVNQYFKDKMKAVGYKLKRPVFSLAQSPTLLLNANALAGLVKKILNDICTYDDQYTFHSIRHTAFSKLQIILENDKELIKKHTIYSSEEIKQIQKIFGGYDDRNKKDIYWNLGKMAGHRSPETLFEHYLHFSDILFANKIKKAEQNLTKTVVLNISGVSKNILTKTIKEKTSSNKPNDINFLSLKAVEEMIVKRLEPFYIKIKPVNSNPENTKSQNVSVSNNSNKKEEFKFRIPPRDCLDILRKIESNENLNSISAQYNIGVGEIMKIFKISKSLSEILTSKAKSRFFPPKKKIPRVGFHLAPVNPKGDVEREEANKAFAIFEKNYLYNKKLFSSCIKHFKDNTTTHFSGIILNNTMDMENYIKLLNMVFYKNRIKLYFTPLMKSKCNKNKVPTPATQISKWKASSHGCEIIKKNLIVNDPKVYPYGKIELHLLNADYKNIIEKINTSIKKEEKDTPEHEKYSSNLLSYFIYILAILTEISESE